MAQPSQASGPLYSTLAEDPDLAVIVAAFVEEMPERVGNLIRLAEGGDWEPLRQAAHQLKGAAGSYGFHPITSAAAQLEDAIRGSQPEEDVRRACDDLVTLCRLAQAGTPP
jgi:HPt (histidine-containing phosphotransfer) domain-containing protein